MIDQWIVLIKENPEWWGYAIVLVLLVLLAVSLRRRGRETAEVRVELQAAHVEMARLQALESQRAAGVAELAQARDVLAKWQAENARLTEELKQQGMMAANKEALLTKTGDDLRAEFKALAGQVLETHGERFEKTNAERLAQTLAPLKDHIGKFELELRNVHESAGKDRAALKTEIEMLTKRSLEVSEEAQNLTQALKGDQQKQGAWGEMVLASILERSGLRAGEEYVVQEHYRNEAGQSFRPDVVVNLPGGRRLVIDSKVSLVAYERAVNADNDAARMVNMKAHVGAIKAKIDDLSSKQYHAFDDKAVDYVIMFMPIESAFSEAVRYDPNLALYAGEKNIVIASPTNLMVALKTVDNLWSVERRNKNAMEIAKRAGALYDKFHGFIDDMGNVGMRLDQAQEAHAAAVNKLKTGRGNLHNQVENLKKLGAKAEKQLAIDDQDLDT